MLKRLGVLTSIILTLPVFASAATCPTLARTLSYGSRGADVIELQQFLAERQMLPADSITGFFGLTTQQYVRQFQCAVGVACYGDDATTGWGRVGAMTRAAIALRCGAPQVIQTAVPAVVQAPVVVHVGCQWYGSTIPHGGTVTGYRTPVVTGTAQCVSETRTCTDGVLSGSFNYGTCSGSVGGTVSCAWNGRVIPSGDGVVAYSTDVAASGTQCISQIRTCSNGVLSGTFAFSDCSVQGAGVSVTTRTCVPSVSPDWVLPLDASHSCTRLEGCAKGAGTPAQTCTTVVTQQGSDHSCILNGVGYAEGQYSSMDCTSSSCWNSGKVYVCRGGSMRWETCGWGNMVGPRDPLSCEGGAASKK